MKLATVQKIMSAFVLMILLISYHPYVSAYADEDLNNPISDYWDIEKDNENDSEKDSKEPETDIETPAADRTSNGAAVGSSVGDYIKVLFALLFVVGLLFGLLKLVNRKSRLHDKSRLMKNMGGLSLGQQKSIQLVIIAESYYLIGVGTDIRLLKEITDPEEINKLVEFYEGDSMESATGMLNRVLTKVTSKSKRDEIDRTEASTDFGDLFKSRLDEMKEERKRHINRLTEKERNRDE